MIAAADAGHPPRRAFGSAAFNNIEAALLRRLDELRDQRAVARGADRP